MANLVKKLFSDQDLHTISSAIGEVEKTTSGEIRVDIRQRRTRKEKKLSLEHIAQKEFHHLGMTKTKHHTGVLIFLLLEDREFHILADEGIHSKVNSDTWQKIADSMSAKFAKGEFKEGVIEGVRSVGKVLATHFPRTPDDINELPDEVRVA